MDSAAETASSSMLSKSLSNAPLGLSGAVAIVDFLL
jgi:hypothetical protein